MIEIFNKLVENINTQFSNKQWLDFEVISIRNGVLRIKASTDFCYYHECEIEFSGVQYFNGPMAWGSNPSDGLMKILPENDVHGLINVYKLEPPCNAITCKTDESFNVVIVAASMQVNFDTVYYYARENLGLHERIDESVNCEKLD